ncbi:hypothetical protein ACVWXY_000979 [Thermostichus sp. MS-CIW-39]|jgi:hypothetical protein
MNLHLPRPFNIIQFNNDVGEDPCQWKGEIPRRR